MTPSKPALSVVTSRAPETLAQASDVFLTDCESRNLSPATLALNRTVLRLLDEAMECPRLQDVTAHSLRRFLIEVGTRRAPSTAQRYYETLRAFFAFLESDGLLEPNPMRQVVKPKAPKPIIEPLAQEDVEALVASCGSDFVGQRDRLVLLLLVDCGLRASELAELKAEDVDMGNQLLLIRHGKGDKSRRVPFGHAVAAALKSWLPRLEGLPCDRLIVNCFGNGIDRYRVRHIILKRAKRAGLEGRIGPHLLRHTCAVSYLRAGGDVFSLQKILGHADLTMTRRYTELADTDVQDKHRQFSPADRLRQPETDKRKRLR